MFLLILSGGGIPFLFYRNPLSFLLIIGYFFLIHFYTKKIDKKYGYAALGTLVVWLLVLAVNYGFSFGPQSLNKYGFYAMSFFTGVLACLHYSRFKTSFRWDLYTALKWLMYHALLNFLAYFVISGSLTDLSNEYYQCSTFKNIFYYIPWRNNYILPGGFLFCRNQGMFWEPGVLQMVLNLLLFLELFVIKKSKRTMWLTVLALLTTYSTTGLVLMFVQLAVKFGGMLRRNMLLLPVVIGVMFFMADFVAKNVEEKVTGERESSAQIRMYDLIQPFLIIQDHPLTGIGIDSDNYIQVSSNYVLNIKGLDYTMLEKGNTNSIMYSFATLGIPITLLLLYCLWKQPFFDEKRWLFTAVFFVSVFFEPILFKQFFLLFIVSGGIVLFRKFNLNV